MRRGPLIGLIAALAAVVVLVAGGGAWFLHHHQAVSHSQASGRATGQASDPDASASAPAASSATSTPDPAATSASLAPGDHALSVDVDGKTRTLILHVPTGAAAAQLPLVLVYHGVGDTAAGAEKETGLDQASDARGILVAYLQGYQGVWNDVAGHTVAQKDGYDDVAFTQTAIAEISRIEPVDASRVAAVGLSNGGFLVDVLGCRMAGTLKLIVVASAPIAVPISQSCAPAAPLSVVETHGTADPTIPYEGGAFQTAAGGETVLSAPDAAARWAALDGCDAKPATSSPQSDLRLTSYSGCRAGVTVTLQTRVGGGHDWPPNLSALVTGALLAGN